MGLRNDAFFTRSRDNNLEKKRDFLFFFLSVVPLLRRLQHSAALFGVISTLLTHAPLRERGVSGCNSRAINHGWQLFLQQPPVLAALACHKPSKTIWELAQNLRFHSSRFFSFRKMEKVKDEVAILTHRLTGHLRGRSTHLERKGKERKLERFEKLWEKKLEVIAVVFSQVMEVSSPSWKDTSPMNHKFIVHLGTWISRYQIMRFFDCFF